MRILLISHTCQSVTEGQARAEYLARLPGIELKVLVPDRWRHYGKWRKPEIPENAKYKLQVGKVVWPWLGPAQWYLHWYPGLKNILREYKPDIIDIWEEPWSLVSAHVCYLRNRFLPNAKIISETEQNIDKTLLFPFEYFRSYTIKRADFMIGRNREAIEILRAKGYSGPAEVVPNGVDTSLFKPLDRGACRKELGVSGFVVGYIGRLVEEKGLMDIIETLPLCSGDVNIVFVGNGPFKEALEERACEIGMAKQVSFIAERPAEELPKIMNAIDVLALVSHTTKRWKEQFGRVIAEAGACGTAVIGSDSGAIPETIGKAGVIVPEKDPKALASAISRLKEEPGLREKIGIIGRKQSEENYSWGQVAERMQRIYTRLCK